MAARSTRLRDCRRQSAARRNRAESARRSRRLRFERLEDRSLLAALLPEGLVSWWRAESNVVDFIGPSDGGTLQNGATFAAGKVETAFSFDGVNDRLAVPDAATLDLTRFTAEAWFRLDQAPSTEKTVLAKGLSGPTQAEAAGNNDNYTIFVLGSDSGASARRIGAGFEEADGTNRFVTSTSQVTVGEFVHVAVTFDGTSVRLYVNGTLESSEQTTAAPELSTQPLIIGGKAEEAGFTNQNYFPGLIDEVSLYSRALAGSEVLDLYGAGSEGKATAVVTTTADAVNASDGVTSLREAINFANSTAGRDVIGFNILSTGVQTISPTSALPTITGPVVIDGYTQPGATPNTNPVENASGVGQGLNSNLLIELSGSVAGEASGLVIMAGGSTVRGLAINRFQGNGIQLLRSNGNTIAGCFIGTNAAGDAGRANSRYGVDIVEGSENIIGGLAPAARNLLSGNNRGVNFSVFNFVSSATSNVIAGNLIGTDKTGTATIPNVREGVSIESGFNIPVTANVVGGTTFGARNVISGNGGPGVGISGTATQNLVQGNYIGTNAAGTAGLGTSFGINLGGPNNVVGGTAPGARNVISGNVFGGIIVGGTGNRILGNFIGTNAAGTAAVPNSSGTGGIRLGSSGNFVGGPEPGAGNLISGNSIDGVRIDIGFGIPGNGNTVQGNRIGTDAGGTNPLANGRHGIFVEHGGSTLLIGGIDADDGLADGVIGAGNTIAFNGGDAVQLSSGTGVRILGNSIHRNAGLGIDLGPDGVTLNDADNPATPAPDPDSDTGGNNQQNFPVISSVTSTAAATTIVSSLTSTPNRNFRIEFFANELAAGCHSGKTSVGSTTATTGASGITPSISFTASGDYRNHHFTVTATDLTTGDTSEFSAAFACPHLIVNTTADVVNTADGLISLREALASANNQTLFPGPDTITFNIPASDPGHVYYRNDGQAGRVSQAQIATTTESSDANIADIDPDWPHSWWTIRAASPLDVTTTDVTLDAYTQPGSVTNTAELGTNAVLRIELDGTAAAFDFTGIRATNGTKIQGFVINRYRGVGVVLGGSGSVLAGNFIGNDPSGTLALGNANHGVLVTNGFGNIVGGATSATRNMISGNVANGVILSCGASSGQVTGNLIGTARDGRTALGNGNNGVLVFCGTSIFPVTDNRIERNVIAFNTRHGVEYANAGAGTGGNLRRNQILSNSIFANGGLGIEHLGRGGLPDLNDPGDADSSDTSLQNYPVLEDVAASAVGMTAFGFLPSTANAEFLIQFFANDAADPSSHGEGQTFLGEGRVATAANGVAEFAIDLPVTLAAGQQLSATATRLTDHDSNPNTPSVPQETSEFSRVFGGSTIDLALGQTITQGLQLGQEQRFRLRVPPGTAARLRINFANSQFGEAYVAPAVQPSVNSFSFFASAFTSQNAEVLLPGSPAPYFISLRGTSTAAVASGQVTLTAEAVGFEIGSVTPNRGSNVGQVTSTIVGTGFAEATSFSLVASDGAGHGAANVVFQNDTTFIVTFDLVGLAPGVYDVRADTGAASAVEVGAFTVTTGAPGVFSARIIAPGRVRVGRVGTLVVEYSNDGETDLPAPLVLVTTPNALVTPVSPPRPVSVGSGGGGAPSSASFVRPPIPLPRPIDAIAQFLAISRTGLAGVLPPGAREVVEIRFQDDGGLSPNFRPAFDFELIVAGPLDLPFSIAPAKDDLRPPTVSLEAWDIVFQSVLNRLGETVGEYVTALDDAATYLSRFGEYVTDPGRLVALFVEQANGALPGQSPAVAIDAVAPASGLPLIWGRSFAPTISRRFDLGALGRGWAHPWEARLLIDPETEDVLIYTAGGTRRFIMQPDRSFAGSFNDPGTLTKTADRYILREPDGTTSRFDSASGRFLDIVDRNDNRVTLNYTGANLTSLIHSNGDEFRLLYNAAGRLSKLIDQAERETTYAYDAAGEHLMSVTGPEGTTSYTYNTTAGSLKQHSLDSVTRIDQTHVFFAYDAQGRLSRVFLDNDSQPVTITYGQQGEVFFKDAANSSSAYFFNEAGQLVQSSDALGRITRLDYDDEERLDRITQPLDAISLFDFDGVGNLTHLVKPDGNSVAATFDPTFNRLRTLHDERVVPLIYDYDAQGNPEQRLRADQTAEQFTFDSSGNPEQSINRRGQPIDYTYDEFGNLTRKDHADGTFETFTYDDRANLRTAVDERGTTTFDYDAADRLKKVTYLGGRFLAYTYDSGGRRERIEDQSGFAVNYRYDSVGRLDRLTNAATQLLVSYTYDEVGRLNRELNGNGTSTDYDYDATGQLKSIINRGPNGAETSRFDYTYDNLGRRKSVTTLEGTTLFGYDAIGQLTSVTLPTGRLIQYVYDAAGNRVATIDNGAATNYSTNSMNQYTAIGSRELSYDFDGNLTSYGASGQPAATYTYDDENRLVRFQDATTVLDYEYDALGNRIAKIENGARTEYLIDLTGLGNVAAEFDSSGNVVARYAHGYGLVSRHDAGGSAAYYDFDALGSTVALTTANGSAANQYSYLPFGERLTHVETIPNPFEYVGQFGVQRDGAGLDFMRARYYSVNGGRFVNEDPIGILGGLNLYQYVNNQPTDYIDPQGLIPLAEAALILADILSPLPSPRPIPFVPRPVPVGPAPVNLPPLPRTPIPIPNILELPTPRGPLPTGVYRLAPRATPLLRGFAHPYVLAGITGAILGGATGLALDNQFDWAIFDVGGDLLCDLTDCSKPDFDVPPPPGEPFDDASVEQTNAFDPNDIVGPAGFGAEHFLPADATLPYTIRFENLAAATAAAQTVTITQQLDSDLDFESFRLLDFGVGSSDLEFATNHREFAGRFDVSLPDNQILDVRASVNLETGLVTWNFVALDAATRELSDDPLAGFLPPNVTPPQGEGSVAYSVRPKPGRTTGARIDATASIVFDVNAPIATPAIFNTLDSAPPTSAVAALLPRQNAVFTVNWGGSDDAGGSGLATYDVFVSDNGGPFTRFQAATPLTSARFTGQPGHTYRFFTQAKDHVGLLEAAPAIADAVTVVETRIWHNALNALDVTGPGGLPDGIVASGDALEIINYINAFGAGQVPVGAPLGPPYYDTVDDAGAFIGDDIVASGDILAVVNFINAFGAGLPGPAGEGEGSSPAVLSGNGDSAASSLVALHIDAVHSDANVNWRQSTVAFSEVPARSPTKSPPNRVNQWFMARPPSGQKSAKNAIDPIDESRFQLTNEGWLRRRKLKVENHHQEWKYDS